MGEFQFSIFFCGGEGVNSGEISSVGDIMDSVECRLIWFNPCHSWLAVWLSGNALASINVNVVALRQTQLVPGWVTDYGRVNHLGMVPAS